MITEKKFWNERAKDYAETWEPPGRHDMAARELGFVTKHLLETEQNGVLDIGIGTGRLLNHYLEASSAPDIFGVDIAVDMVASCRARFAEQDRITGLVVADASSALPFARRFDFISAVRVLKYTDAWRDAVRIIGDRLTPYGTAVFSMPNRNSINRFSRTYGVPWHTTTVSEIEAACGAAHLRVVEIAGFTRLPYSLYARTSSPLVNRVTLGAESTARALLGPRALTRELFVAVRRG